MNAMDDHRGRNGPQGFLAALEAEGYEGEVARDRATRTVYATDNSVYELVPAAVLFPRRTDDLNRIMRASARTATPIVARGGGTGTNGQSLSESVIVDCARHLTAIESIDPEAGVAVVQPGVILDELNRAVAPHGLFFAPTVSTASRATLGGMTATEASGKGSRIHGRTSDHVLTMDVVLSDASDWHAEPLDDGALAVICRRGDLPGALHRHLRETLEREAEEIERVYPVMYRGLTGYNLKELRGQDGTFRLSKLLAGSEGTLALTKRLTLRLTPRRSHRALMVVAYADVMAALGDVARLVAADPEAVEFIDDRILDLAQQDPVWADIEGALAQRSERKVRGLNFVEIQADDADALAAALVRLQSLDDAPADVVSEKIVRDPRVISQLWALRAKCVGLLGRMDPSRQGTPFVEDAAVPPAELPDFVAGFRDILDRNGLSYGMFGHADVGCIHVRPALDMRRPEDAAKLRPVSDAVARLAQAHGGLIWGEHGKGFRGEYGPMVFGERLYAEMCRIKAAFDPGNLLNPGKIAVPQVDRPLDPIETVPLRGARDATIGAELLAGYEKSVACNGNAQCLNRAFDEAMCPSFKASGDRRQSPKGRAALLREWLRMRAATPPDPGEGALEDQLHETLSTCLGCKACASQCPVKVDIPAMRARFYAHRYRGRGRPLRHYLLAALEPAGPILRAVPGLSNAALRIGAPLLRAAGLVDLPAVRPAGRVRRRPPRGGEGGRGVVLLEDSFLATFDGAVIDACEIFLAGRGYDVYRARPAANGKALHVLGMLDAFARVARKNVSRRDRLAAAALPLVGLEPAVQAMWDDEYAPFAGPGLCVWSLDAFLEEEIAAGRLRAAPAAGDADGYRLFSHCTEKTADPRSAARWQAVFRHFGLDLEPQPTGCCGMAGTFGHEIGNREMSRRVYDLSWRDPIEMQATRAVATGFSCRCQVERFSGARPPHPVEVLMTAMS